MTKLRFVLLVLVMTGIIAAVAVGCVRNAPQPVEDFSVEATVISATNEAVIATNEAVAEVATAQAVEDLLVPVEVTRVVTETVVETVVVTETVEVPVEVFVTEFVTVTEAPTLDASMVYTGSVPNECQIFNTAHQEIQGEQILHDSTGLVWMNSAIGAAHCAASFEGRWFEGFKPDDVHHVTAFFSSAENVSVYQGSVWLHPPLVEPRQMIWDLAKGKCSNWVAASVETLPVVFDYVDLTTLEIVHTEPVECTEILNSENTLPDPVGLIPGELVNALPHFGVTGAGWGTMVSFTLTDTLTATTDIVGTVPIATTPQPVGGNFTGISSFTSENRGMACRTIDNPLMGENVVTLDPLWDPQCIYLLDGMVNGQRGIGLVRGEELLAAATSFSASVWSVPAGWIAASWANQFASDNCPVELPISIFENGAWTEFEVHSCN